MSDDYHVRCGLKGIYAGKLTTNEDGFQVWTDRSEVTEEAICAVATYMYGNLEKTGTSTSYTFNLSDGTQMKIHAEVTNKTPDWNELKEK